MYRCASTSVAGFIQQLSVSYITHGHYYWYVTGRIPPHKDPRLTDARIIERHGLDISKWTRYRQRRAGQAKTQYLRYREFFVLVSTSGEGRFRELEGDKVRDARRAPIHALGYAIGVRRGRALVRIERRELSALHDYMRTLATHASRRVLEDTFVHLPYEPYRPVRKQLLTLLKAVNQHRRNLNLPPVRPESLRRLRRIVRPFGTLADDLEVTTSEPAAGAAPPDRLCETPSSADARPVTAPRHSEE